MGIKKVAKKYKVPYVFAILIILIVLVLSFTPINPYVSYYEYMPDMRMIPHIVYRSFLDYVADTIGSGGWVSFIHTSFSLLFYVTSVASIIMFLFQKNNKGIMLIFISSLMCISGIVTHSFIYTYSLVTLVVYQITSIILIVYYYKNDYKSTKKQKHSREYIAQISNTIKEARKEKGMTQQELADKLYVSRSTIAKFETGKLVPNNETLSQIMVLLNINNISQE